MGIRRFSFTALLFSAAVLHGQGPAPSRPPLETIPSPSLSPFEPAVARQIRVLEAGLDAVLTSPSATDAALAEAFGEFGQLFHAYELWEPAAASYRNAAVLAPGDFRWRHLLAELETKRGDLESARRQHVTALALRPDDVPSLVGLGNVSLGLNRPEDAERSFRRALRLSPDSAAAHAGLARLALLRRDYEKGVLEFEAALQLAPEATRLHYELAMAYRGLGRRGEAARHFALAGTVGVRVSDPLLDGVSARRQGERTHLVRGRLAFVNGRMREAADEFAAAVAAEPRSVAGLVGLGSALGTLGESDRALDAFRRALALAPDSVSAHYNLGRILAARGETEAALREYDAVLRLAPRDEDTILVKADLLARWERFAEARETLEDGHRRMPEQARLEQALAQLLAACPDVAFRDGARSLDLARRAFDAVPTPAAGRTVALALAEIGRCDEAASFLEKMLAGMPPDHPETVSLGRDLSRVRRGPPCRPPVRQGAPRP